MPSEEESLSRPELLTQWETAFELAPPPYLSIPFMIKALAYQAQCKRAGGLPAQTRRALAQIATGKAVSTVPLTPTKVGTHYVREWNGRTYQVAVVEKGYEMDGRIWPSLSAIAKHITGTTWSGPRFFGIIKVGSAAA
jgi:hypothetical protein